MRTYLIIGLIGLALLLAGNTALQKYEALKASNAQLSKGLEASNKKVLQANALVDELHSLLELERELQTGLQQQQSQLSGQLEQSKSLIARLRRENKELSDWADTALPEPVKRLRKRPAITGAADYQDWLSSRNSLHFDGNRPANQRQSAD